MPKGKGKKTKEDILEYQKIAQRRRREKIKEDAELHAEVRKKDRERYYRRKADKKILPIDELPPARRNLIRKRNRENFKVFYMRQKQKKTLKNIEEITLPESKAEISTVTKNDNNDPLCSVLCTSPSQSKDTLCLNQKQEDEILKKKSFVLGNSPKRQNKKSDFDLVTKIEEKSLPLRPLNPELNDINDKHEGSASSSTSTDEVLDITQKIEKEQIGILKKEDDQWSTNIKCEMQSACSSPVPLFQRGLQRSSSNSSIASTHSEIEVLIPKVMSPAKRMLKRFKYKTNKEIQHLVKKIYDLKSTNEKYKHKINRLKRLKCECGKYKRTKNNSEESEQPI